jgi:hypothetical protein
MAQINFDRSSWSWLPVDVRFAPTATEMLRCREMTRCAIAAVGAPWYSEKYRTAFLKKHRTT